MIAPDSATVTSSSVTTGDLPSGWTASELGRREHRLRVALVALDLVLDAELLEQPEHALRARIVEVVDGEHRPLAGRGGDGIVASAGQ